MSDDRRQAHRRHGQSPKTNGAPERAASQPIHSIRRHRSRPRASRGHRAGVARGSRPVSGQLCGTTAWRRRPSCPGFLSPFLCRRSLLGHPVPAGEFGPPHGRLIGHAPEGASGPRRSTAFRTHELRPGWVSSKPRGRRCSSRTEGRAQPAPAGSFRGQSFDPALAHPSCGLPFARHQRGFTRFTRPVCPSPVAAGMERPPSGFPRGFTPRRLGADESRRGGARPSSTNLELHAQHHIRLILQIGSSLVSCDLASHRPYREEIRGLDPAPARSMRATALDRLLATASQAIGKSPSPFFLSRTVVPEFMPKHNCALIGNGGRATDESGGFRDWRDPGARAVRASLLLPLRHGPEPSCRRHAWTFRGRVAAVLWRSAGLFDRRRS